MASLVSSLTLQEKIYYVIDASAGSTRLGLPPYEWWSEATHGIGSATGVQFPAMPDNFSYVTSFPAPILTAASSNDPLQKEIGSTIGREGRAFGNNGFSGFDFWAPNINMFRDPRWGRGQETPGEDAFVVQSYVRNFVPGLQGDDPLHKSKSLQPATILRGTTLRRGDTGTTTTLHSRTWPIISWPLSKHVCETWLWGA